MIKIAEKDFIGGLVEGDEVTIEVVVKKGDEYEIVEENNIFYYYIIKHKGKLLQVSQYDIE